jgi:aminotransferase
MKVSNKILSMPPSGIRAMFAMAEKYDNVISFGLGDTAFPTPPNVIRAAQKALDDGYTHYVSCQGLQSFRQAVAKKSREFNEIDCTEDNVHIAFGAGAGLLLTFFTLLDPGDEVIVHAPCFPNYLQYIGMTGAVPVVVDTYEKDRFRVTPQALEAAITPRTRAILINSPCNPTGAILEREDLERIARVALDHDLVIVSDEPYETILFDGKKHCSIASLPGMRDHVITVNSLSKTYAMTGWRVGYIIAPVAVREQMTLLQEAMGSNVTSAVQVAAAEALNGPQDAVWEMSSAYEKRRNILVEGLNSIKGISCLLPGGSFYAFANIRETGMTSDALARMLLEKVQVVTTPGNAFGDCGEGYLRLVFAQEEATIKAGLERIRSLLGSK